MQKKECICGPLWRSWISYEELGTLLFYWQCCPCMATDAESCSQHTLCFLPLVTPFSLVQFNIQFIKWAPLVEIPYTSDCCLIGIWHCIWRTSSGRECTGHSDICVTGRLQAVDSYFDVLGLHIGLVSLLNEAHRLRDGLCTVCQEPGEGPSSRTIDDLQSGPPASGVLYFHTVECPSLFLFEILLLSTRKFCASLVFLSSALAGSVFLIASCHLIEAQWRETGAQKTFLLLVFYFLLELLWDGIDFECKERSALEQACGEVESLLWGRNPLVPATGIGICVRLWDMPLMPGASGSDKQREERQRTSTWGRQTFCELPWFFSSDSETAFHCILIQMFKLHIRDNFYLIWSTSQNDRISIRENEEASASDTTSLKRKYFPSRQKLLAKYSPKIKIISTKNSYVSFLSHELTWVCGIYISYKIFTHFPFSAGKRKS